jgi:lipopolysaccharide assembly protein A
MTRPTLDSNDSPTDPAQRSEPDTTSSTAVQQPAAKRRPTRTGNLHAGLFLAAALLVLLVVFLVQNAHTVTVSFLGAHVRVSLAVALLAAALAGALIIGAAGTARIMQLRLHTRRTRGNQPQ